MNAIRDMAVVALMLTLPCCEAAAAAELLLLPAAAVALAALLLLLPHSTQHCITKVDIRHPCTSLNLVSVPLYREGGVPGDGC